MKKILGISIALMGLILAVGCKPTVIAPTVESIAVTSMPDRTSFYVNEAVDYTGLEITANYSDGSTVVLEDTDFESTGYDSSAVTDELPITVTYSKGEDENKVDFTTTFDLKIIAPSVKDFTIDSTSYKNNFYTDDEDFSNLVLTAQYIYGPAKQITEGYTVSYVDGKKPGDNVVKVKFGGVEKNIHVTVTDTLTVSEFLARLGTNVETITANKNDKTMVVSGTTANIYGVKLTGEFSKTNKMPASLKSADLSGIDIKDVSKLDYMFNNCKLLSTLDVSNLNTTYVTSMVSMFEGCKSLTSVNMSNWKTTYVESMCKMFKDCSSLNTVSVKSDTHNVKDMSYMFSGCVKLSDASFTVDVTNVEDMAYMFNCCKELKSLELNFKSEKVKNMSFMFTECRSLTNLTLNMITSNVKDMTYMFANCAKLSTLNLGSFDTANVESMNGMFSFCSELATIKTSDSFVTTKVSDSSNMFSYSEKLSGGVKYNSNKIDASMANYSGYFTNVNAVNKGNENNNNPEIRQCIPDPFDIF